MINKLESNEDDRMSELVDRLKVRLNEMGYIKRSEGKITALVSRVRKLFGAEEIEESEALTFINKLGALYEETFIDRFLPKNAGPREIVKHHSPERREIVMKLMAEKLGCSLRELEDIFGNYGRN